ncbi:hypothetical protein GGTG_07374 [Gaeumannomyces tritici R3-111a-1]|uniref:Uncharacterized protein n=1 Tax=Gaeumannomyces tritici (strain R3-111a-1) TaxID=644352 RepID=J3P1H7_GAET3|nr:hypothetical protein GGTG_07374 [Gaeumannomyces tritici R3-111a-1]EJT77462.1 hypothetical protein GGTG_07374 [Gaeumannomyces tritici R3-111a-1]
MAEEHAGEDRTQRARLLGIRPAGSREGRRRKFDRWTMDFPRLAHGGFPSAAEKHRRVQGRRYKASSKPPGDDAKWACDATVHVCYTCSLPRRRIPVRPFARQAAPDKPLAVAACVRWISCDLQASILAGLAWEMAEWLPLSSTAGQGPTVCRRRRMRAAARSYDAPGRSRRPSSLSQDPCLTSFYPVSPLSTAGTSVPVSTATPTVRANAIASPPSIPSTQQAAGAAPLRPALHDPSTAY